MKIVFNVRVGIDVPSYVQAGEVLDKVTQALDGIVGERGSYDVSNFEARHRPIHAHEFKAQAPMGMVENTENMEARERF